LGSDGILPDGFDSGIARPEVSAMESAPSSSRQHNLAINNEAAVLAVFRELLEDEGYRVSTQRYAEKDLAEIVTLAPNLTILDYMWASDDVGWSLLQMLRMDPRTSALLSSYVPERFAKSPNSTSGSNK